GRLLAHLSGRAGPAPGGGPAAQRAPPGGPAGTALPLDPGGTARDGQRRGDGGRNRVGGARRGPAAARWAAPGRRARLLRGTDLPRGGERNGHSRGNREIAAQAGHGQAGNRAGPAAAGVDMSTTDRDRANLPMNPLPIALRERVMAASLLARGVGETVPAVPA